MKRATSITALGVTALMACGVTHAAEKLPPPNILWLTSEDNNVHWVGCYGNEFADTPNIDKLAKENNTTIYEMVRNPKLYNVSELMNAANFALEKNPSNLSKLHEMLSAPDCGVRYWGAIGCLMLDDNSPEINKAMQDESHTVRAVAAWSAIKNGDKETGLDCLAKMLADNSYAKLRILNIVDWIGDDAKPLIAKLDSFNLRVKWTGENPLSQHCGSLIDNLKKKYR